MKITVELDGKTVTADFVRSEDAGFSPGCLLLDLPCGDTISIYRRGRIWIEARIANGVCQRSVSHKTRRDALHSAAIELLGESLFCDSIGC